MPRYASEKYALGISDRSGAAYKLRHMKKEWNGFLVGNDEWEEKQPQLDIPKFMADPQALRNARPDRTEPAVEVLLAFNSFISGTADLVSLRFSVPATTALPVTRYDLGT